jgi:hypothetical protein
LSLVRDGLKNLRNQAPVQSITHLMPEVYKARWKTVLVLVLLAGVAGLQIAGSFQAHDHGRAQCCAVCHAGHMPLVQPAGIPAVSVPDAVQWRLWRDDAPALGDRLVALSPSRAPPA